MLGMRIFFILFICANYRYLTMAQFLGLVKLLTIYISKA